MTASRGIRVRRGTWQQWAADNQGKHLCECGCGGFVVPRPEHFGKVPRFIHGHNALRGEANQLFKRGWALSSNGYRLVSGNQGHPFAFSDGLMLEHRRVVERHLRETSPTSCYLVTVDGELYLDPEVDVHHIDGDKQNNAIENLQPMTKVEHQHHHHLGATRKR